MEHPFQRLFTVEEANDLLPVLQEILQEVYARSDALREKGSHMEPILEAATSNGGGKIGSEYGVEAYRLYLSLERIRELGVILKDLNMGLVDFPHRREGRIVFLCWHPPEERVEYWHEIEAGYAGRQPL
ncbi:MAG: DUF2203 domain-containing protein [Rubrobacteraceae bacterium]